MTRTPSPDALHPRILSRRELLRASGALLAVVAVRPWSHGEAALGATGLRRRFASRPNAPACVVRPTQTEGPYFVDERLNRSDIRSDPATGKVSDGAPFLLGFNVSRIDGSSCEPLAGAIVDIWHCDAAGVYSDATDPSFNTKGQKFLRGYQVTDADGGCQFLTIYPGWYLGRAVHIHFKIRTDLAAPQSFEFTSQLYFDDTFTDQVYLKPPYLAKGPRSTRNENDSIYRQGGSQLVLAVQPSGDGCIASFDIGLQGPPAIPTATLGTATATATATGTPSATSRPSETSTPTSQPTWSSTPEPTNTKAPSPTAETIQRRLYLPWATKKH